MMRRMGPYKGIAAVPKGLLLLAALSVLCAALWPARGAAASVCNETLRVALGSNLLPDCRAYEMVSPPYKEGYPLLASSFASNGESAILNSQAKLAGNPGSGETIFPQGSVYLAARGGGGWDLTPLNPSLSQFVGQIPLAALSAEADDGDTLWEQHTPAQPASSRDLYVRYGDGADSFVGPLSPHEHPEEMPGNTIAGGFVGLDEAVAATHDYGHVAIEAANAGDRWEFDATAGETRSLYEYSGTDNSEPVLVGVEGPKGSRKLIATCGTSLGSESGSDYNALSADGETIFFTVDGCLPGAAGEEIYARIHGALTSAEPAKTVRVSESECTEVCSFKSSGKNFEGASEDGSKVFFTSTQKLTNDAVNGVLSGEASFSGAGCAAIDVGEGGCNLYEYDFARSGEEKPLRSISMGGEVLGVAAISEDGSRVYYVSHNAIAAAGESVYGSEPAKPAQNLANLYVYDTVTGRTAFVATLSNQEESEDRKDWRRQNLRPVELAGTSGQYMLFASSAKFVTPDAVHAHMAPPTQLYEYKAEGESDGQPEAAELVRVTQGEGGFDQNGIGVSVGLKPSSIATVSERLGGGVPGSPDFKTEINRLNLSEDGRTVFFETAGQLSPRATSAATTPAEAGCTSLYEFRTPSNRLAEGTVRLISDGRDVQLNKGAECGAQFQYTDASGSDVLFSTANPLLASDTDGFQRDLYDAREDGGFVTVLGGSCGVRACEGGVSSPSLVPVGTSANGHVTPLSSARAPGSKSKRRALAKRCRRGFARKHGKCVKRRHRARRPPRRKR
jgi:hypothetical protein